MRELRVKLNDEIKWQLLDLHALEGKSKITILEIHKIDLINLQMISGQLQD